MSVERRPATSGVAARADAPVPQKRAAWVITGVLVALAPLGWGAAEWTYDTANEPPAVLTTLRRAADPVPAPRPRPAPTRSAVLLIADGLRADEARRLGSWRRFASERATVAGAMRVALPSLSAPFQHTLFTGVPQDGTGVRTNRFAGPPRLDTLIERVHARGGRVAWILERDGGIAELFARRGDRIARGPDALGRPLANELARIGAERGEALTVIHVLAVDATAHQTGTRSPGHAAALRIADRVIWRAEAAARAGGAFFLMVSDHGHIRSGGHGGAEPEVVRAPFLIRHASRRPRGAITPVRLTEILAGEMAIDPPRSAAARGLRARILEEGIRYEETRLANRRLWMVPLALLASLMMLGAIKRAFRGLDAGSALAAATYLAGVLGLHDSLLERPLSMSAFEELNRHGPRLFWLGAAVALTAIGAGVAAWRSRPDLASGKAALAERMRRSAAATGFAATVGLLAAIAWCGGALGPWPLGAFAFYAPTLAGLTMLGACCTCSAVMAVAASLTPREP